ncbi:ImmA/IrrE family metallo-endopeptidase [Halalkalibacter sp. APA_J-10(15)]|uniref:ImmA/IrrE family metallo-endopeptidase n=1 Tax=unclassified Halalkalibacter TaxID=2893063 RepID=UPI001FF55ABE|nr:ImmA/IrrE family metallo-endopeptidase [Halalkalibacter sp. APA_J-10(15)]MCK0472828.1 ImmA/IrrE family metallo-endopeptidase [Halalkalibacter sp. APA_J-10(15)]
MPGTTFREDRIMKLYEIHNIRTASDLTISNLSASLNFNVTYYNYRSRCIYDDQCAFIYLNRNQPIEWIRYDFFHEMAHFFEHSNDQRFTHPHFVQYQERQAHTFALYASMPRFILNQYLPSVESISELAEIFQLPESFVRKRMKWVQSYGAIKHHY